MNSIATMLFILHAAGLKGEFEILSRSLSITRNTGESLLLNCTVKYKPYDNTNIPFMKWCKLGLLQDCLELSLPPHLISMSESKEERPNSDINLRKLTAYFEVLNISHSGKYQCRANNTKGASAMGHIVTLIVTESSPVSDIVSHGQKETEPFNFLTTCAFLIILKISL